MGMRYMYMLGNHYNLLLQIFLIIEVDKSGKKRNNRFIIT